MPNVRERAVEGDAVADVNVEAVLPVGLVHPVRVGQRERFALLTVTWVKHTQTGWYERCRHRFERNCASKQLLWAKHPHRSQN